MGSLIVEYCGELHPIPPGDSLTMGRSADLIVDDNPYLHRTVLRVSHQNDGSAWIENIGDRIPVSVADADGLFRAELFPSGRVPIVFPRCALRFSAGNITYEVWIQSDTAAFRVTDKGAHTSGNTTMGIVSFTSDQFLLIVALAEPSLLNGSDQNRSRIPTSGEAAARLGWTLTKFNRKLDNVCEKLARAGVKDLRGTSATMALERKGRLVEYALATSLVTRDDLQRLP